MWWTFCIFKSSNDLVIHYIKFRAGVGPSHTHHSQHTYLSFCTLMTYRLIDWALLCPQIAQRTMRWKGNMTSYVLWLLLTIVQKIKLFPRGSPLNWTFPLFNQGPTLWMEMTEWNRGCGHDVSVGTRHCGYTHWEAERLTDSGGMQRKQKKHTYLIKP